MADPRFFTRSFAPALKDIAKLAGGELSATSDPEYLISDIAPLDCAGPGDLSFFDNVRYAEQFKSSKAGACIVAQEWVADAPRGMNLVVSPSPYKSYALTAQHMYPETQITGSISDKAIIDKTAEIGPDCTIEEGAIIREGAKIGPNCRIEAYAVIGRNVVIGAFCRIGINASISHAHMGDHSRLYPGARVGQDGFGFAPDAKGHIKIPQLGRVMIGDHVEIGANTTIDRGSGPDTIIGQGTWIDNLVQIGHNVRIGKGCIIVAQVGISGSTVIDDYAALGGQVGVAGHLHIGKGAQIAAQSGIMRDVPPGEAQMGYPAMPIKSFMRQVATLNRLIKKNKSS